ncbi:MAG: BON domain-containing protein [Anaerolineae bacterium]|nr:BON domain-containing protein [Anaerolineae bacterium]
MDNTRPRDDRPASPADHDMEDTFEEAEGGVVEDRGLRSKSGAIVDRPVDFAPGLLVNTEGRILGAERDVAADRDEEGGYETSQAEQRARTEPSQRENWPPQPAQQDEAPYASDAPRSYKDSDAQIYETVMAGLRQRSEVDPAVMTVYVAQAVVTLTGTVDTPQIKQMVGEMAASTPNVADVRNMLYVVGEDPHQEGVMPSEIPAVALHTEHTKAGEVTALAQELYRGMDETGATTGHEAGALSKSERVEAVSIPNPATIRLGTAGQTVQATVMVDPGAAVPEVSPVTAVTDEAGRTTELRASEGMAVVGANGERVGTVKAVRVTDFLVDRSVGRAIYVPIECVQAIEGDRLTLKVASNEVNNQGWAHA